MQKKVVTKMDLARAVAGKTDYYVSDVLKTIDALFREIKNRFKNGDRIALRGFGTFYAHKKKPRKFMLPNSGATGYSKGSDQLKFKMSKKFNTEEG